MKIQVIALGNKMPPWVNTGCEEYLKRLPREVSVEFKELPLSVRGKTTNLQQVIDKESEQLLGAVSKSDWVIALDSRGQSWSTEKLAEQFSQWQMNAQTISILIGGPDGMNQSVLSRANQVWSLSALTLPHPLVRVLLVEQLYRAWSILQNHPYHK